ncbi:hypothetical protein [Dasania marina]|uniref:hypothetical protein n=1 Tax=Dasania marina TaxID=471499 RepID=UPI001969FAFB|nr:hypothetical protein [Dasania marina]
MIGNLTTVTSSLSNFAVALLGFRWANEINANVSPDEKPRRVRETFLRYEQLAGYLRYLANDKELMGITRVSARMENDALLVSFGLGAEQQILSDQASYGLWGLYSTASAESGLISGDIRMPTALGLELAEQIERAVDKQAIIALFTGDHNMSSNQLAVHAKPFVKAINKKSIRSHLLQALMNGGDRHAVQSDLWAITEGLADKQAKVDSLTDFIALVKRESGNQVLIQRLQAIEAVERILVAANNLFNYCRQQEGESLRSVLNEIGDRYHYAHLPADLDLSSVPRGAMLQSINVALRNNDTAAAIGHILELNKVVMAQRSGAPWVEVEPSRKLRVRVPTETYALRSQQALETEWDYEYFISSFLRIASQAQGVQWKAL